MPEGASSNIDPKAAEYLTFGGMAVVEGVMMRSPNFWSVACRAPNGKIVVMTEPLEKTWIGRQQWLKKPFLRGTLAILDTMVQGMRAMNFAGNVQTEERYLAPPEPGENRKPQNKKVDNLIIAATVVASLAISFFVFKFVPEQLAEYTVRLSTGSTDINQYLTVTNYIAEVVKIGLFIAYLAAISRMPAIHEVFRYHGAEHKAINAVEANLPLSQENALAQTRLHPRCGTNFAIIVAIVTFLIVPLIPRDLLVSSDAPGWLLAASRVVVDLAVLPLVAGISYEVIRAAGRAKDKRWVNTLLAPGLATQYITTAEPAPAHIDVAVASLRAVMVAEETGELTNTEDYESAPLPAATPVQA